MNTTSDAFRDNGDMVQVSTVSSAPWWEYLDDEHRKSVAAATQNQCQSAHTCGNGQCNVQFIDRAIADKSAR